MSNKLNKLLKKSNRLKINNKSKLVIMSDCHRGIGNNYDNFSKNRNIYEAALNYYYDKGFTYVELGDGDDMWEVKNMQDIIEEQISAFYILKKFHDNNRLIMIYGNHDIYKKKKSVLEKNFYKHYNKKSKKYEDLLNNLEVYESYVLDYQGFEIFMLHGHQVDLLNNTFWHLSRFLVRYIWKYLEYVGIKDPTSAAKNYKVSKRIEKKLKKWSTNNNKILIAGHTHRPIFPILGESLYFNDGSCVHPNGITCIEIENGKISLVKWRYKLRDDNTIFVGKELLAGNESISNFFNTKSTS